MDDADIQSRIEILENEERSLRHDEEVSADAGRDEQVAADRDRLGEIKIELDQLWDLLRQRRALRNSGGNPEDAQMRDPGTVERYLG